MNITKAFHYISLIPFSNSLTKVLKGPSTYSVILTDYRRITKTLTK